MVNRWRVTFRTCYPNAAQSIVIRRSPAKETVGGGARGPDDNFVIHGPECCRCVGQTVTIGAYVGNPPPFWNEVVSGVSTGSGGSPRGCLPGGCRRRALGCVRHSRLAANDRELHGVRKERGGGHHDDDHPRD